MQNIVCSFYCQRREKDKKISCGLTFIVVATAHQNITNLIKIYTILLTIFNIMLLACLTFTNINLNVYNNSIYTNFKITYTWQHWFGEVAVKFKRLKRDAILLDIQSKAILYILKTLGFGFSVNFFFMLILNNILKIISSKCLRQSVVSVCNGILVISVWDSNFIFVCEVRDPIYLASGIWLSTLYFSGCWKCIPNHTIYLKNERWNQPFKDKILHG